MRDQKPVHGQIYATESQLRLGIAVATLILAAACSPGESGARADQVTRSRYLMGTPLTITVVGNEQAEPAIDAAFDEVDRVETMISTWQDDSSLAALNASRQGTPVAVDAELFTLLEQAVRWSHSTGGAFDPAAGRILFAWDLRGEGRVPSQDEIERAMATSGARNLVLDPSTRTVTRRTDLLIEEGGFGKGYALDRARDVLREAGIHNAFLDFGGQVTVIGPRPVTVGIASPADRMSPGVELDLASGSIATSSGSERFFESGGQRYSHIFDPRTGRALPPRGSATVVHESGLVADILATALYVMGPEAGLEWSDRNNVVSVFIVPGSNGAWRILPSREATRSLSIRSIDRDFKLERKQES